MLGNTRGSLAALAANSIKLEIAVAARFYARLLVGLITLSPKRVLRAAAKFEKTPREVKRSLKSAQPWRRRYAVGLSAAAMVAIVLPLGFIVVSEMKVEAPEGTFETAFNETRTEQLADGSVVSLGARSRLQVQITEKSRVVHLLEGEAMFKVSKEAARPFVVTTFLVDVTTGAAKFSVAVDTTVEVAVQEGVVEVSMRGADAGGGVIVLKPGERYRVPVDSVSVAEGSVGGVRAALFDG